MAKNNMILLSAYPKGMRREGEVTAGEVFKPGMVVQSDGAQSHKLGRPVFKLYNRDADGNMPRGAYWIVLNDYLRQGALDEEFAAGARVFLYSPVPGDELNLLLGDVGGTGDAHAADEILMADDGTGKFIATTGTPESECAKLLEAVTAPTADTLAWCEWTGH